MMDVIFVAIVIGFFALTAWLTHFCARLMGKAGQR
jgi:hypothetical protein